MLPIIASGLDYYWVGGSGNWSDLSHWASTSGGSVQHDQIPTSTDNVIFDQNSFSAPNPVVNLNLGIIFCRNLDFRNLNQPIQISGAKSTVMSVHGSVFMHPDVNLDFAGSWDFKSDAPGNELHWFGQTPFRLNFLGNGEWTFATDLTVDSLIHIEFGNLRFENAKIQCFRFQVHSQTQVNLNLGNSEILITGNRILEMPSYRWRESLHFEGGQVNIVPGNSTIKLTGTKASIGFHYIDKASLGNIELGTPGGDHLIYATWNGDFTFTRLYLLGNTFIQGYLKMQQLDLEGGNVYTFHSHFEQHIGTLSANSDCSRTVLLKASEGGLAANFIATGDTQNLDFVMLQDIHVTGSTYEATNSVDLGGNEGWTIMEKTSDDFYWIGGNGNWNDTNNWSFTSGGSPSGCLPMATDDVIFDQNSFSAPNQVVTVNIPTAFCHNMDWRNINQLASLDNSTQVNIPSIHIFGSLWMSPQLSNNYEGDFYFESAHGMNEILTSGNEFNVDVIFNGASGEWTLQDKLDIEDTLFFNSGTLFSNDQELECFFWYSETSSKREIHLGSSVVRLVMTPDHPYYWSEIRFNANNLNINPGTSLIKCENSTNFSCWAMGMVDLYEIQFEGFGSIHSDYNNETQLNIAKATFFTDGDLNREIYIDTLILSPGWKYTLTMNTTVFVDSLNAQGNCDGSIFIGVFPKGIQAGFNKSTGSITGSELILDGIKGEGGASFFAQNSIDLGRNDGWTFTQKVARTLFWVGRDTINIWHSRKNWSLKSGGPEGACIPTAIDTVIFDQNSFGAEWEGVSLNGSKSPICYNMIWENVPNFVSMFHGEINITGSLTMEENVNMDPWRVRFISDSLHNTITTSNNRINWVDFQGNGRWDLEDDFWVPYEIWFNSGTLRTHGYKLTTGHLVMDNYPIDFNRTLILDTSHVHFDPMPIWQEQLFINSNQITIKPGESKVEFTGESSISRQYGNDTLKLHNVLFSNTLGTSTIEQWDQSHFDFNKLQFNNDGIIYGSNEMDSLFLAPGKEYELEFGKTQKIFSLLYAIGNNCIPISIRSTEPGNRTNIFSPSAKVVADFVQLQDQSAFGGANFTAGSHSTDISNNTGWIFDPAPDHIEVGFLGGDRTLCQDSSITLSAFNFSPNESYIWKDNLSTSSTLDVSVSGTYWAQVTFENNCVITDTVMVRDPLSLMVDLGLDTTLCEGENLLVDANIAFPEARYTWQDSTEGPQFLVSQPGTYFVDVEVGGCFFSDSILIEYNPLPKTTILGASSVCEGDTVVLDATLAGASYLWQDNTTQSSVLVLQNGTYSVAVEVDQCVASDTVEIIFTPKPPLDLGRDTLLCANDRLDLNVFVSNTSYTWQDGTQAETYTVESPGLYWVSLTRDNCSVQDSIRVNYKPRPQLPALADTILCEGTQWTLALSEPNVNYVWNTGIAGGDININQAGTYSIQATLNECESNDTFIVQFEPPPTLDLGADLILCEGEQADFEFSEPLTSYTWQDGSETGTYSITETGNYFVLAGKLNCHVSDTVEVLFNPLPRFSLGPDLHLCPGDSFSIHPDQAPGNLIWQDGSLDSVFDGKTPGIYWLEMEATQCIFRDSVIVTNSETLLIDLGPDTIICDDKTLTLDAFHPEVISYAWQDGSVQPEIEADRQGTYQVTLSDGNCSFDYTKEVQLRECHYFSIFVPNAFTPNSDGINDAFLPLVNPAIQINQYNFQVYNRWGDLVYTTTDPSSSWDGTFNGSRASTDTYIYYVEIDYLDDEGSGTYEKGGSVVLME